MAFGKGKDTSNDTREFKRYVGVASVKVVAINPTMEEWNTIMGTNSQKELEYVSTTPDGVKQAKITLLLQTNPKKTAENIDTIIPVTFWFRKLPVQGSQSGKYQIIDKYGRTAWATKEEIETKKIPQYSNGPANIDIDYRPIVQGEEVFTNFLKAHLNIPAISYLKQGIVVNNPNPSECEARLNDIKKIFEGDFSEIKNILAYQPNNYSKMLFGVKTTEDGKEYQDVFMQCFLSGTNNNNTRFATELAKFIAGGRHTYDHTYFGETNPNGELIIQDLHERVVTPSTFTDSNQSAPSDSVQAENEESDLPF